MEWNLTHWLVLVIVITGLSLLATWLDLFGGDR